MREDEWSQTLKVYKKVVDLLYCVVLYFDLAMCLTSLLQGLSFHGHRLRTKRDSAIILMVVSCVWVL